MKITKNDTETCIIESLKNRYTQHKDNTFDHYYKLCRGVYLQDNPEVSGFPNDLNNLKLNFFNSSDLKNSIFGLGEEYRSLISKISAFANRIMPLYGRRTIASLHLDGNELSKHPEFDPLFDNLLSMLMPTIEREFAGAYCRPWYVSMSRSVFGRPLPADNDSTWMWHFDATPQPAFKLFFYLTDVDENSAPFTYLVDEEGKPAWRSPEKWKYISRNGNQHKELNTQPDPGSRIPIAEVNLLKEKGYEEREVHMPAGSFMVWAPNHIHKATQPRLRERDVLQVQLRPVLKKPDSHWFGSNGRNHNYSSHSFDWWAYD